eukprot:gene951-biopygen202
MSPPKIIRDTNNIGDLGVMMSADGSFTDHINHVVDSATDTISTILRSFRTRDPELMITLWKALVIPKLEYCSQLWCPTKKQSIAKLEALQRNFLGKVAGANGLDYWEGLKKFNIFSLQRRRERYRIIYIWKMLENHVPNVGISYGTSLRNGRTCTLPTVKCDASQRIQSLQESSVSVHGARLFNSLPACLRDISGVSIDIFKRNLDNFLRLVPNERLETGYTSLRRADSNSLLDMQSIIKNITFKVKMDFPEKMKLKKCDVLIGG